MKAAASVLRNPNTKSSSSWVPEEEARLPGMLRCALHHRILRAPSTEAQPDATDDKEDDDDEDEDEDD